MKKPKIEDVLRNAVRDGISIMETSRAVKKLWPKIDLIAELKQNGGSVFYLFQGQGSLEEKPIKYKVSISVEKMK